MSTTKFFKGYRRKQKTDYDKRLSMLKSGKIRLVVRLSQKNIYAQLVEYRAEGDRILFVSSSRDIAEVGWKGARNNLPAAYLIGYSLARKASSKVKEAILDIGRRRSTIHSRVYALAKGVREGGILVNIGKSVFPESERIAGGHIKAYAEILLHSDKGKYEKLFSSYLKKQLKPEDLPKHFEDIKSKL